MKTPYPLPPTPDLDPYTRCVLEVAAGEGGVTEDPTLGMNRGPEVDLYLRSVRLRPEDGPVNGYPWCAAFVYWCFAQASAIQGMTNPCRRTAGVVRHWDLTRGRRLLAAEAAANHSLVRPGMVFCKSHDLHAHTGLVVAVTAEGLVTIEGNTNLAGSREGNAVVGGKVRPWSYIQLGFVDYAGMAVPVPGPPSPAAPPVKTS